MRLSKIPWLQCGLIIFAQIASAQAPNLDAMDLVLRSIPDGPVARVSGRAIPKREFLDLYKSELARASRYKGASASVPDGARVQLAMWCVGTLIEQEVLHQIALRRHLTIPASEVEARWKQEFEQMRRKMSPATATALSEAEVLGELGFASRDEIIAKVERAMLVQSAREQIVSEAKIEVSDEDAREVYDRERDFFTRPDVMHLRQIFVRVRPGHGTMADQRRDDARGRAEDALARIDSGQRFDNLVRSMSDAPDNKTGGDIGPAPIDTLPPFLVEPALTLEPGDISGIIESEFGFHIVQLIDLIPGSDVGFTDASAEIRRRIRAQKAVQHVREYCGDKIDNEFDVKVYLELEKTLSINPGYRELRAQ